MLFYRFLAMVCLVCAIIKPLYAPAYAAESVETSPEVIEDTSWIAVEESLYSEEKREIDAFTKQQEELEKLAGYSKKDIDLIALVVMAEAEAEPIVGQRLVVDTILNRVDHPSFPDTVHDVIYQKAQFTSMTNGRVDRCQVKDELVALVKEEIISRYNNDVIFFRTSRYSDYGMPLFLVGHHYFSAY